MENIITYLSWVHKLLDESRLVHQKCKYINVINNVVTNSSSRPVIAV